MPRPKYLISGSIVAAVGMSVLIGVAAPASAGGQWTVTNLHSPPGAYESFAYGISGGQQVGYTLSNMRRASLWSGSAASSVDLNPAGAAFSAAFGISSGSGGGKQVGYAFVGDKYHASLWSGSASSWVDLNPAGATHSEAFGVGGGQQVGWAVLIGTGARASLWSGTAASWVNLHPPYHSESQALGISNDGQQQVGWTDLEACMWSGSAESWVDLHPAAAIYVSQAVAVSGGQQVGKTFVGVYHASLWTGSAASWVDLHPTGAYESFAYGVFGGQQVGKATVGGKDHASLWSGTAASWVDLHAFVPAGFDSSTATSIWSDANFTYVAGYGHNTQTGFNKALLWTYAIPTPCVADVTGDDAVNINDLLAVISTWVPCKDCPTDINGDGAVDVNDLLAVIIGWGPCP